MRKCVCRETDVEYAVKIIDKSQDEAITESITAEMQVLNYLPKHPNISEFNCMLYIQGFITLVYDFICEFPQLAVSLKDVFESSAFIFMIFEL